jgi:hypothetical protein
MTAVAAKRTLDDAAAADQEGSGLAIGLFIQHGEFVHRSEPTCLGHLRSFPHRWRTAAYTESGHPEAMW